MRKDRHLAVEMRKAGKSYNQIKTALGISKSTLSNWLKESSWSKNIKSENQKVNRSREHIEKMQQALRLMWQKRYTEAEEEAAIEFEIYKNDPLFMAGLMAYAGEGDKRTKNVIRLANVDFFMHRVFLKFIEKFTKTPKNKIKFSILLYPDLDVEICINKWSQELNIPIENFHKPIVIQGRSKIKRLHFGVGSTIISNSFLKRKLLLWIEKGAISLCS